MALISKENIGSFLENTPKICLDYFPYGMLLPNRHEAANEYRYGYQGSEKDNKIQRGIGIIYLGHKGPTVIRLNEYRKELNYSLRAQYHGSPKGSLFDKVTITTKVKKSGKIKTITFHQYYYIKTKFSN